MRNRGRLWDIAKPESSVYQQSRKVLMWLKKKKKKAGSKLRQIKDMHKPSLGDLEWKSCSACFSQLPKIPESLFRQNSPLINTSHSLSSSLSGFIGF